MDTNPLHLPCKGFVCVKKQIRKYVSHAHSFDSFYFWELEIGEYELGDGLAALGVTDGVHGFGLVEVEGSEGVADMWVVVEGEDEKTIEGF